jgi:hypothetical protein
MRMEKKHRWTAWNSRGDWRAEGEWFYSPEEAWDDMYQKATERMFAIGKVTNLTTYCDKIEITCDGTKYTYRLDSDECILLCGRIWTEADSIWLGDDDWWLVGCFSEGDLYMNNLDGEMALLTPSNKLLYTKF